jgi:hypothetical protein
MPKKIVKKPKLSKLEASTTYQTWMGLKDTTPDEIQDTLTLLYKNISFNKKSTLSVVKKAILHQTEKSNVNDMPLWLKVFQIPFDIITLDKSMNTRSNEYSRLRKSIKTIHPNIDIRALKDFSVSAEEFAERNKVQNEKLSSRKAQDIVIDDVYEVIKMLIKSDNLYDKILLVMITTGSRSIEVVGSNTKFSTIQTDFQGEKINGIKISNLAKKRDKEHDKVVRPVLILTNKQLIKLIKDIRKEFDYEKDDDVIARKVNTPLNNRFKQIDNNVITQLGSSKDLRALYAGVVFELFRKEEDDKPRFIKTLLGHKFLNETQLSYNLLNANPVNPKVVVEGIKSELKEVKQDVDDMKEEVADIKSGVSDEVKDDGGSFVLLKDMNGKIVKVPKKKDTARNTEKTLMELKRMIEVLNSYKVNITTLSLRRVGFGSRYSDNWRKYV